MEEYDKLEDIQAELTAKLLAYSSIQGQISKGYMPVYDYDIFLAAPYSDSELDAIIRATKKL